MNKFWNLNDKGSCPWIQFHPMLLHNTLQKYFKGTGLTGS
jgi:hypothetical protein